MSGLPFDASALLIVFARLAGMFAMLPAFSEEAIPVRIRLTMGLGLTVGLRALVPVAELPGGRDAATLALLVVTEGLVGLALGSIVRILFQAAAMAGSLASLQVGLSSAVIADPSQGGVAPLLSRLIGLAAIIVCLSLSLHHLWIASFVKSYAVVPVGGLPPARAFADLAVQAAGRSFLLALGLAAPLIVYGILFNLGLGLCARIAPSLQVFFVAQPLNLLVGLSVLAMALGALLTGFATAMADFIRAGWSL